MKKVWILLPLVIATVIFIQQTVAKVDNEHEQAALKKIEKETQECIDTNYQTDYQMMQCVIKGTEKYNIEIQKILQKFKKVLSESQYNDLIKAEEKWGEFIELNNTMLENTFKPCPPYLPCLTVVDSKYEYTKHHAEDLVGNYGLYLFYKREKAID